MSTMYVKNRRLESTRQFALAWKRIAALLDQLSPGWDAYPLTGLQCAERAIRNMDKIKITLVDENGKDLEIISVKQDLIGSASMLVFRGTYYHYYSMGEQFFSDIKFMRCTPPINVD